MDFKNATRRPPPGLSYFQRSSAELDKMQEVIQKASEGIDDVIELYQEKAQNMIEKVNSSAGDLFIYSKDVMQGTLRNLLRKIDVSPDNVRQSLLVLGREMSYVLEEIDRWQSRFHHAFFETA